MVVGLLSAGDLIELYSAVQNSVDVEEKRRRANQFDDAVAANIRELFDDPKFPKRRRSFGVIRKSFGGYFDDEPKELHKHLIRMGASHKKGSDDDALWHLPESTGGRHSNQITRRTLGIIAVILTASFAGLEVAGFGPTGWFDHTSEIEQILRRRK